MRGLWGCQLAVPIFFLSSLIPLGLLYPFTDSLAALFLANFLFDVVLAIVASIYRRKAPDQTLRRAIAAWLVILAPCFAMLNLILCLGEISGL